MKYFVEKNSIVRKIWGRSDTVLLIFAGSAAEFALNKAVDWLYFTGRLPADPIGRLFSTVTYAREIIFAKQEDADKTIGAISSIHKKVEQNRGASIPAWAYRDVLFMLIHYSIAAFETLERKLDESEKEDVYQVFFRFGTGMGLSDLPATFKSWLPAREAHMNDDLVKSKFTTDLFRQYKKNLGPFRYRVLLEGQIKVMPEKVRQLLGFRSFSWLTPILPFYKFTYQLHFDQAIKALILPKKYKKQIFDLDIK
ncbi:hypothetical protein BH20BAC1_BH20BAC1_04340 [soil metagenome]